MHRRRLFIALPLLAALAGGLWWNSMRMNETERKLVGVWESVDGDLATAMIILADRRQFVAFGNSGSWDCAPEPAGRWKASRDSYSLRGQLESPFRYSLTEYLFLLWLDRQSSEIVDLTSDNLILSWKGSERWTLRRSTDPELLALFNRLSAGESP